MGLRGQCFGGFPDSAVGKNPPATAGDTGSIPRSGRSPREGNSNPLQYSCLGNPMDKEPGRLQSMGSQRVRHDLVTKQQQISCTMSRTIAPSFTPFLPTSFLVRVFWRGSHHPTPPAPLPSLLSGLSPAYFLHHTRPNILKVQEKRSQPQHLSSRALANSWIQIDT